MSIFASCFGGGGKKSGYAGSWQVDQKSLQYLAKAPGMGSFANLPSSNAQSPRTRASSTTASEICRNFANQRKGFAVFQGMVVAVKSIKALRHMVPTNREQQYLRELRELQHDNLNTFMGLVTDNPEMIVLVWRYCQRGSLEDILFNHDMQLDMMFKSSMIKDVVKGLEFLHSKNVVHGLVAVDTCMVDSRWLVKLSSFGLYKTLLDWQDQETVVLVPFNTYKLFHFAPELLRADDPTPSKASDIYSLGMILYQIIYRQKLFDEVFVPDEDIITDLIHAQKPPLRPHVPSKGGGGMNQLMKDSWLEAPSLRPTVVMMRQKIYDAFKDYSSNLMDHMVSMLEKYANNLEKIVQERTLQLDEERKRADNLLYQMLPRSVADALKAGRPLIPESYDCATVFFSDVVGFTNICSKSTPIQVVDMLNALYSQFDNLITKFDSYKVETIGDAYLVVSGVPARNGDKHVFNIAKMSINIQKFVTSSFVIPHMPGQKIQIRIGLHSGPVAAGVVGLSMPRYCLFGDTVNMASRLESNGLPGRIHISGQTMKLLATNNNYVIECRGVINLKGKGEHTTYWLEKITEDM